AGCGVAAAVATFALCGALAAEAFVGVALVALVVAPVAPSPSVRVAVAPLPEVALVVAGAAGDWPSISAK
ncbi:MAG: hypothetical protein QOG00_1089, partial [Pyrinomonadaceae bacterium]|nr:hypothetical protein [Pyrinomonadaceae bacterium]